MSNVLKVKFKESYLNNENINYLLNKYEFELKTNDFAPIIKSEQIISDKQGWAMNSQLCALVEFMSDSNIEWPLEYIKGVFSNCEGLISVIVPDKVTRIEMYSFQQCINLTQVTLPEGLKYIGTNAFYKCTSLTNLTLPTSLEDLGLLVFPDCSNLHLTMPKFLPDIHRNDFDPNIVIHTNDEKLISWCKEWDIKWLPIEGKIRAKLNIGKNLTNKRIIKWKK